MTFTDDDPADHGNAGKRTAIIQPPITSTIDGAVNDGQRFLPALGSDAAFENSGRQTPIELAALAENTGSRHRAKELKRPRPERREGSASAHSSNGTFAEPDQRGGALNFHDRSGRGGRC